MKYEIEVYGCLCQTSFFQINGIEADHEDFVDKYDHDRENAPDYGCGDMSCDIREPKESILIKYNITEKEYYEIAEELSDKLSFGSCGWCI